MIVVTGANGRLGGAVIAELLKSLPPTEVGASTTRPEELGDLAASGVRVRAGSYDDPDSLRLAFEGADRVLLISAPRHGDAAIEAHRVGIEAARAAGVERLFYTSHVGADALSPFPPATTHAATEVLLRDSGLAFTALRNGFYADTPIRMILAAVKSGVLRVPIHAPVSWTMHRDLAPGIASLLQDASVADSAINLTAGRALDMATVAEEAATALGQSIAYEEVSDSQFASDLAAAGVPEIGIRMTLGIFLASRQRHFGIVDPTLTEILGRPTTSLASVIEEEMVRS